MNRAIFAATRTRRRGAPVDAGGARRGALRGGGTQRGRTALSLCFRRRSAVTRRPAHGCVERDGSGRPAERDRGRAEARSAESAWRSSSRTSCAARCPAGRRRRRWRRARRPCPGPSRDRARAPVPGTARSRCWCASRRDGRPHGRPGPWRCNATGAGPRRRVRGRRWRPGTPRAGHPAAGSDRPARPRAARRRGRSPPSAAPRCPPSRGRRPARRSTRARRRLPGTRARRSRGG